MSLLKYFFRHRKNINQNNRENVEDPYIEIAKLVKEARASKNISLKDLSNISKIPLRTLKAIENNNKELRPKYPFIRSILNKLEEHLRMENNLLLDLAKKENLPIKKDNPKINLILKEFDLINSWHGNIIYFLLILFSIFILNRHYLNIQTIELETDKDQIIKDK